MRNFQSPPSVDWILSVSHILCPFYIESFTYALHMRDWIPNCPELAIYCFSFPLFILRIIYPKDYVESQKACKGLWRKSWTDYYDCDTEKYTHCYRNSLWLLRHLFIISIAMKLISSIFVNVQKISLLKIRLLSCIVFFENTCIGVLSR